MIKRAESALCVKDDEKDVIRKHMSIKSFMTAWMVAKGQKCSSIKIIQIKF